MLVTVTLKGYVYFCLFLFTTKYYNISLLPSFMMHRKSFDSFFSEIDGLGLPSQVRVDIFPHRFFKTSHTIFILLSLLFAPWYVIFLLVFSPVHKFANHKEKNVKLHYHGEWERGWAVGRRGKSLLLPEDCLLNIIIISDSGT